MAIEAGKPVDALFDFELPSAPYPGLRPFDVHEWPIFFGRETATNEVAGQLIWQQLVVVHGDPGCGKTSFIRAGVIAQLEQQYARSEMRWRSITVRPHEAPLKNLAQALANVESFPSEADRLVDLQRILNLGRHAPAVLAERLCRRDSDPICIHVDQFEDLFTFAGNRDRKEAQLFVDVFVGLHENPPAGIHAILTMSSRYLGDCSQFAGLTEAIDHAQYPLERIAQLDLISAILEPARIYGGDIARELAERLIADAGDRPNQLPLIQHALMFLLRRKLGSSDRAVATKSWQLGLSDYGGGGGLGTLLSAHADEVVNQAAPDPNKKRLVQGLFRALLDVSPKGDVVRRPRTFKELLEATGSDAQTLKCLIDQFRAEGVSILTPYGDAALNPDTLVCISCDVLVEFWQRLSALRRLLQAPRDFTSGRVEAQTHNVSRGRGDRSLPRKGFDVFLAYARESGNLRAN